MPDDWKPLSHELGASFGGGEAPDGLSDHEAGGMAPEFDRFVGIAGVGGACGFGEGPLRVQTGGEECDACQAATVLPGALLDLC